MARRVAVAPRLQAYRLEANAALEDVRMGCVRGTAVLVNALRYAR